MKSSKLSRSKYNSSRLRSSGSFIPSRGGRFLFSFIESFVINFMKSIPFSGRVFLRKNIGSLTYSWATILFSIIWVRFILDGTYDVSELTPPSSFSLFLLDVYPGGSLYYVILPIWYIGMFFIQFGALFTNFIPAEVLTADLSLRVMANNAPFFISLSILILGLLQKLHTSWKHSRRVFFDPMHRGDSLIFGKILDWLKPQNRERTLIIFELTLLLIITLYIYRLSLEDPKWLNYFVFFIVVTIAMGLDEWLAHQKRIKELEIRFANEAKAQYMQEAYESYKKDQMGSVATVVFVAAETQQATKKLTKVPLKLDLSLIPKSLTLPSLQSIQSKISLTQLKTQHIKYAGIAFFSLSFLFFVLSFLVPNNLSGNIGRISVQNLTLRIAPNRLSQSIDIIPGGSKVEVLQCGIRDKEGREWCKVEYNGNQGFCSRFGKTGRVYLTTNIDAPQFTEKSYASVSGNAIIITENNGNLNLRVQPSINSGILAKMPHGSTVKVIKCQDQLEYLNIGSKSISGSWCKVRYGLIEGYCFSWYLRDSW